MKRPEFNQEERALLSRISAALREERETRQSAQKEAFLTAVKDRLAEAEPPTQANRNSGTRSFLKRRFWFLAAAAFLGLIGVMAMMTDMFSGHERRWRQERVSTARVSLPRGASVADDPAMLAGLGQQMLVMLLYEHHGEPCLWVYPQQMVRPSNPREQAEFDQRKKWYARVEDGRLAIPEEALSEVFGKTDDLILMRVDRHLEIWSESGLTRYLASTSRGS